MMVIIDRKHVKGILEITSVDYIRYMGKGQKDPGNARSE